LSEFEQKVLKLLEDINGKLDKLLKTEPAPVSSAPAPSATPSAAPTPVATTVKPSAIVDKQEEAARMEEKPPVEGRRICPECGGTSFATHEDRSQVLHQMGGVKIYAKKYVCKSCGYEH
jgi:ribosomal protein S27AE